MSNSRAGTLWAITSYYNPAGYRRRLANFRAFRARLTVPLVAVELAYGPQFELAPGDADILVQLRGRDVMWQKERLLNLALRSLPEACANVAALDCDVVFGSDDWADRVEEALRRVVILQPYSHVYDLPRDGPLPPALPRDRPEPAPSPPGLAHAPPPPGLAHAPPPPGLAHAPSPSGLAHEPSPPGLAHDPSPSGLAHEPSPPGLARAPLGDPLPAGLRCRQSVTSAMAAGVPAAACLGEFAPDGAFAYSRGIAWAARRELLDRHHVYDVRILGGGDRAFAGAVFGYFDAMRHSGDPLYLAWAVPFHAAIGTAVGAVVGDVYHLWHGELKNRNYHDRLKILDRFAFDATKDIALAENGCWRWNSDKPEFHESVRSYFASRREDG